MSATNREGKSFNDGTWSKTQMATPTQTLPRDEWTARANQRMRDLLVPADGVPNDEMLSSAAADVLAERQRQVEAEGWTPEHDDAHAKGEMAAAAACYAFAAVASSYARSRITDEWYAGRHTFVRGLWPWNWSWWKPTDRRRDLVKAGALILAEIERLDRAMLAVRKAGATK